MKDNRNRKKTYRILVTIAIIIPIVIAISYAYFQAAILGEDAGISGKSTNKFEIDLVTENNGYINATNVVLIKEENIAIDSEKGFFKVVSGDNKNYINYSLSLTELTISANLQVADFKWQLVRDNEVVASGNFGGVSTNSLSLINDVQIANNDTHEYEFRIWLQETSYDQIDMIGGTFSAKITMTANLRYNPVPLTLRNAILWQEDGTSAIISKGNPNFSSISTESDTGIYAMEDEYGTSYYYRGNKNILKNNLIFGGFQWKILRINGDGSIRIIYNGTEEDFDQNGTMNDIGPETVIGFYTYSSVFNDNKYVGYMYGGPKGVASTQRNGSIPAAANYNQTDSDAKVQLDLWYEENISGQLFENKIADNIFCNDRQFAEEISGDEIESLGYGQFYSSYAPRFRIYTEKKPTLKCALKNDRFTTIDTIKGNGALTYPVGLITIDEAMIAGLIYGTQNVNNYLFVLFPYYTMSPYAFFDIDKEATIWAIDYYANISGTSVTRTVEYDSLRPVINLKADIIVTGEGTLTNPYRVTE